MYFRLIGVFSDVVTYVLSALKDNTSYVWEIAVHLAVVGDVCDGVFLSCPFSHEMSWMGSWTKLSQFLRVFLPTLVNVNIYTQGHL